MFTPVDPVRADPPALGLVAAAVTPNDNARWQTGMAWRPERCPQARGMAPACGIDVPFGATVGAGDDGIVYYQPPAFRAEEACTTRGGNANEIALRVRRQALAITSYMVANELNLGTLSRTHPHDLPDGTADQVNAFLAGPTTVVEAGTWDPYAGLGRLEELARRDALGLDVYLHLPIRSIPLVANALIREGNRLRTYTGAVVVADAGYTGGGLLGAGTSEVQTVTITGTPTGGTFGLTYLGDTTAQVPFNATAAALQAALEGLPTLDPGDVTVTGGPAVAAPLVVTFDPDLGNVTPMVGDNHLTGGTAPAVAVAQTTPGVAPAAAAGTFWYATGPVQVRLSDVVVSDLIDQATNQRLVTAERMFAATFDPCNAHSLAIVEPATT